MTEHRRDSMWCVWVRGSEDALWRMRQWTMSRNEEGAIRRYEFLIRPNYFRYMERQGLAKCIKTTAVPTEELGE